MGQKTQPLAFRLGFTEGWRSRWFSKRDYREYLRGDVLLRAYLVRRLEKAGIERVNIDRSARRTTIEIHTARPGFLIGRGGGGAEELKKDIVRTLRKITKKDPGEVRVEIQEVRKVDTYAALIAQRVASDLERRLPFRRVLKRTLEKVMSNKEVKGAKIMVGGRLGGAEMSRREWTAAGRLPLQTLRADIDYAQRNAYTTYGVIGVKVWIYKGEVFSEKHAGEAQGE